MKLKRIISAILMAVMCVALIGCTNQPDQEEGKIVGYEKQKAELAFNKDGKFKILMLSDIQDDMYVNENTVNIINTMLDEEEPDLVLLAGDNAGWITDKDALQTYLETICGPMEERGIYWAHVYGNHDHEGGVDKEIQQEVYMGFEYCLSMRGPEDISGVGNYVLQIKDSAKKEVKFNVWGIDSGTYTTLQNYKVENNPLGSYEYDYIHADQVMWYYNTSKLIEKEQGKKVAGLMYMHIALPETRLIRDNPKETGMQGESNEDVCNGVINSGMFASICDRGDVVGVFAGHDHTNTFWGKYAGVMLGYCPSAGYDTYGLGGAQNNRLRGGRVFVIDENDTFNPETYVITAETLGIYQ